MIDLLGNDVTSWSWQTWVRYWRVCEFIRL